MTTPTVRRRFRAYITPMAALLALAITPEPARAQETPAPVPVVKEKDPFAVEPLKRASASLPLPFGIIAGGAYPIFDFTLSDNDGLERETEAGFEVHAYIDAWQLGYMRRPYGDVFRLTARTVGRDVYSGWFFEYGTDEISGGPVWNGGDTTSAIFERTVYSIGSRYQGGMKEKISAVYLLQTQIGLATYSDEGSETDVFFAISAGIGGRMPLGPIAVQLNGGVDLTYGKIDLLTTGMLLSGNIGAVVALNLESE